MSIEGLRAAGPRGSSNRNARGSSADRRRRRAWLVETYRADTDILTGEEAAAWWRENMDYRPLSGHWVQREEETPSVVFEGMPNFRMTTMLVPPGEGVPCCRCYRCGVLLTVDTVTADRIIPGCEGGTYRRNNIRPACADCNQATGAALGGRRAPRQQGRAGIPIPGKPSGDDLPAPVGDEQ